jgi:hypothetical protein
MNQITELKKGEIYNVTESCGMLMLKGKYLGIAQRGLDNFFVFENVTERDSYKFFGAKWRINCGYYDSTVPSVYLISTHYGNSIKSLKPVAEGDLSIKFNEEE